MRSLTTSILAGVLLAASLPAAENSRLVIRAASQFDIASTALYSIFLASRNDTLRDLVVSCEVPPGTRFLEDLDIPSSATYEGVARNIVKLSSPAVDRETLLGPFTLRVKVENTDGLQRTRRGPFFVETPVAPEFSVSYRLPVPELLVDSGVAATLQPLAETASITFDQAGTLDASLHNALVPVGSTGILLYVPAGAVDRSVKLTFRRLTVDDSKVPQNVADTWWCGLYQVTVEPQVTFAKPISYALPTRRAVPSGLTVRAFSSIDSKNWKETIASGPAGTNCVTMPFAFVTCTTTQVCPAFGGCPASGLGGFGGFGAFGVNSGDRTQASSTSTTLTQQFGTTFKPAQISDGTSNIIAILIGFR